MKNRKLLVIDNPAAPYLRHLARLPEETDIVAGMSLEMLAGFAPEASTVLCGGTARPVLEQLWSSFRELEWIHSMAAGLEGLLFPELAESPVVLTNSRGVFARSLGEFAVAGMLFFAKDLRRMLRQQQESRWEPFDVEELNGRVLGIVGYGAIGRAAAARSRAFGMKIHALRRRPELSAEDPLVDRTYQPHDLDSLVASSDYLLVATPFTKETRGMIGDHQIRLLKPGAVVINLGRGPVISEASLLAALREGRIRGAVLDVFDVEPLPPGHPFYSMDNVLLSPHCADHTETWLDDAMDLFVRNYGLFLDGKPLMNIADKTAGY